MNYSKKGVRAKQKTLNSKSQKWGRKIALTCVKVMLAAVVGIGICGVSAGIGIFKGILASTPNIRRYRCFPRYPLLHPHDPSVGCRGCRRSYHRL